VTAALVTALIAASAWVTLPLGAVPVTLQMFFVVLAALLLSPGWAAASMAAYLVLGAVGLPVFAGGQGGLGIVVGPTGGYLIGFVIAAFLGAHCRRLCARRMPSVGADALAATVVVGLVYLIGAMQLAVVAGLSVGQAVVAGVVPFLLPDAAKAAAAVGAAALIRRARR
jgi:biotin transport system substrate-specific component